MVYYVFSSSDVFCFLFFIFIRCCIQAYRSSSKEGVMKKTRTVSEKDFGSVPFRSFLSENISYFIFIFTILGLPMPYPSLDHWTDTTLVIRPRSGIMSLSCACASCSRPCSQHVRATLEAGDEDRAAILDALGLSDDDGKGDGNDAACFVGWGRVDVLVQVKLAAWGLCILRGERHM